MATAVRRVAALVVLVAVLASSLCAASALEHFPEGEDLNAAIDRFQKWFEEGYGPGLGVRLSPAGDGMRMGVFATREFKPEEPYLSIPMDIIIGEHTIFQTEEVGPVIEKLQKKFPQHYRAQYTLGLFLIHQRFVAGDDSFWKPYLDLIPTSHDSPAYYSRKELEVLTGTMMPDQARALSNEIDTQFDSLNITLWRQRDVFPTWALTRENWRWAAGILNSRMIWWDNGPHLVPMLDMINCRQGPRPHERRVHATRRHGSKAVTLAPWKFAKGDQVFENYGQPNPTYFLYHGFTMHPNVHDCAKLPFTNVDWQGGKTRRTKKEVPRAHKVKALELRMWREDYCVSPTKFDDYMTFSRLIAMPESQLAGKTVGDFARPRAARKEEVKALRTAALSLQARLDLFPKVPKELAELATAARGDLGAESDIQADEARLWAKAQRLGFERWIESDAFLALPFRERMSLQYRESQRTLIVETIEVLRAQKRKLPKPAKKDASKDQGSKSASDDDDGSDEL